MFFQNKKFLRELVKISIFKNIQSKYILIIEKINNIKNVYKNKKKKSF